MYASKMLLESFLWTAHGVKTLPYDVDLSWSNSADGLTISAMPFLEQLFHERCHIGVLTSLRQIPLHQYDDSIVVRRDVRRIPLKLDIETAVDEKEAEHLKTCFDGLFHFYPVDIYPENIASRKGLLTALRRLV